MHVAGIIAAKGEASFFTTRGNVAGLAWQAPIKMHGARTDFTTAVNVAHLANLVRAGAKVINLSGGLGSKAPLEEVCSIASVKARLISRLAKHYGDFIYVLAAGNSYDKDYFYQPLALLFQPEKIPACQLFDGAKKMSTTDLSIVKNHIIIVANADTRVSGKVELYAGEAVYCPEDKGLSAKCGGSNYGTGVEIAAPGVDIKSLGFSPSYWTKPYQDTGTSMSAPQVAAALAVAWSIKPTLSAEQAKQIVIGDTNPSPTARRMISDIEGRKYPLLDLDDVVNKALATTGQSKPPVDPTALAPLVIYATCTYSQVPYVLRTPASKLNVRITNGFTNFVEDEGLLSTSYATALPAGAYVLMLQAPTGSEFNFTWNNASPTKSIPFTLAEDPSGNVRTMHVEFAAATKAACEASIDPLPAPTVTGVGVVPTATATINIPATAFVRGTNVALSTNGYGADTLANAPPYGEAANAAEWDFNVPMAGTYELVAEYAAAVSRPVTIAFNGAVKFPNALATVTGGWFPANRQTISQGFVTLPAGVTTMRVSRGSVFPHIRGFNLVPVKSANLLLGAQVSDSCASCPFDRYGDPNKLTDGDVLVAARNLGTYIGNFNVTLPYPITLDRVVLTPAIAPNRVVSYEILTSTDPLGAVGTWTSHGGRISKFWTGGVALETPLNTVTSGVRVVRLVVYASPSWVSLTEIQGFNGGSPLISGTFSVPANNPTGTLFTVPTGVGTCTFNASGSWNYGFGASSSAAGVQSFNGDSFGYVRLLPSTPYFSLIANTAGGYRAIGSGQTVSVSGGQSMQFQINEGIRIGDSYADNSGALSVSYQCQ